MIWVIGFPALTVLALIVIWFWEDRYWWLGELFGYCVLGAALALIPGILLGLFAGVFVDKDDKQRTTETVVEIRAMSDGTQLGGSFFLFGGSIDSEPVYSYFYMDGEGFRKGWVPAEDVLVIEESETQPRFVKREYHNVDGWWWLGAGTSDPEYVFYVPPGTVTNKFNLDLED